MKIKRVFASDMRQAIRLVRDEHGPDAVILSSRNVDGGVEVISAIDYDENAVQAAAEAAPAPGASATPTPAERLQPAERSRLSVTVGDDADDGKPTLSFAEEPSPPPPAAGEPAPGPSAANRIQWTQEPAMQAMREELRTLRSLFQSQLTLLEWQQMGQRSPVRAALLRRLHGLGLGPDVCRKLADHVREGDDPERAWNQAMTTLARHLPVTDDDIVERGGIAALVGPTGVGKTTTVAKLAARFALRHGKRDVALVTTDNFRIGGQDQLRSFARIVGVPVHTAGDAAELERVLADLADKRLVLIDTAGMSQRDLRLGEQLQTLRRVAREVRPYLVLSAGTQVTGLMDAVRSFRAVGPAACILSKTDEAGSLGGAITAVLRARLPVAYVAHGQRVPEDLRPARSDRLLADAQALVREQASREDDESLAIALGAAGSGGE